MMSNVEHYKIGELAATVSSDVGLAANARLYLVKANLTSADFVDVGIPPTNGSVVNTMIAIKVLLLIDKLNLAMEITSNFFPSK